MLLYRMEGNLLFSLYPVSIDHVRTFHIIRLDAHFEIAKITVTIF